MRAYMYTLNVYGYYFIAKHDVSKYDFLRNLVP